MLAVIMYRKSQTISYVGNTTTPMMDHPNRTGTAEVEFQISLSTHCSGASAAPSRKAAPTLGKKVRYRVEWCSTEVMFPLDAQRRASGAPGSGSEGRADAGGRHLHALVRRAASTSLRWYSFRL